MVKKYMLSFLLFIITLCISSCSVEKVDEGEQISNSFAEKNKRWVELAWKDFNRPIVDSCSE